MFTMRKSLLITTLSTAAAALSIGLTSGACSPQEGREAAAPEQASAEANPAAEAEPAPDLQQAAEGEPAETQPATPQGEQPQSPSDDDSIELEIPSAEALGSITRHEGWEPLPPDHQRYEYLRGAWSARSQIWSNDEGEPALVHSEGYGDGIETIYTFSGDGEVSLVRMDSGEVVSTLSGQWHLRQSPEHETLRLFIEDGPTLAVAEISFEEDDNVKLVAHFGNEYSINNLRRTEPR